MALISGQGLFPAACAPLHVLFEEARVLQRRAHKGRGLEQRHPVLRQSVGSRADDRHRANGLTAGNKRHIRGGVNVALGSVELDSRNRVEVVFSHG